MDIQIMRIDCLRFIHKITHEKRSSKPYECRGGILADEMGMGKSLSLLALVMHTLDHARVSSQRFKETFFQGHEGGHPSRATLIITPKSSTEFRSIFISS